MKASNYFHPIASRDLIFVSADGHKSPIHVAVGAPYFPAKAESMSDHAGCLVLTCDDPDLATEVFGIDEMEALAAGLEFLEVFLIQLTAKSGGALTRKDGQAFDPRGSVLLQESREIRMRIERK